MKISIRANILTLFMVLLITVSLAIISINYYTSNKIIRKSAHTLLQNSTQLVITKLHNYFLPFKERLNTSRNLIAADVINPNNKTQFDNYLLSLIKNLPNVVNIYFGATNGGFTEIKRLNGKFLLQNMPFDHSTREWYKFAVSQKRQVLSNMHFSRLPANLPRSLLITSAVPIYNKKNKLLGVMGMNIPLTNIIRYMKDLQISKNSIIIIVDKKGNFISSTHRGLRNLSDPSLHLLRSFNANIKLLKKTIEHEYNSKKYMTSLEEIKEPALKVRYVAIISPLNDIIGPLQRGVTMSILLALFLILIGGFAVWLIATKISNAIIRLSKEANDIEKLELKSVTGKKSLIKELFYMQNSFVAMRSALQSFAQYVPYRLVKKLVASKQIAKVGGQTKEITLLFSDIQGFTSLSEPMSPEQLTNYLSEYFEKMTQIIHKHSGTVDKYVGDEIMAFWGAPSPDKNQALNCCQCALSSIAALKELNKNWRDKNNPQLTIRIGINTGVAIVGNIGSKDRLSYTAMGDSVNLANRLQTLNKIYKSTISISKTTYEQVKDNFEFRLLDYIAVRGRKQGCYVYELLIEKIADLAQYNLDFQGAFKSYTAGKWEKAIEELSILQQKHPKDELLGMYIERCNFLQQKQPRHWRGIWIQYD